MSVPLYLLIAYVLELSIKVLYGLLMKGELWAPEKLPLWYTPNMVVMMVIIGFGVHMQWYLVEVQIYARLQTACFLFFEVLFLGKSKLPISDSVHVVTAHACNLI